MVKEKRKSIGKAAVLLMIGTALSKVLGLLREFSVAYKFGAGSISDAFVLTNGIPNMLFSAVGVAIGVNFIPCFSRLETEEEENKFTSNIINLLLVILTIGSIIVSAFPKVVLELFASGLDAETERYAVIMLQIVVWSILPIVLTHVFQAYNQARGEFVTTAIQGIIMNVSVIAFTFISTEKNFYLLSIGTIAANLLGMIFSYIGSRKSKFQYYRTLNFHDQKVKELVLLTLPLLVENIASNLSLLVDRNLASYLNSGTISGLSYAGYLGDIAATMIASAIMTATFPSFSRMLAKGENKEFYAQFEKYASVISYILAPISLFMIINADDIVTVLFEHGAFTSTATQVVSESMICYAVGVLPMGLQSYLVRSFYAMKDTRTPVKIKVFSLLCNIVLNLITVRFLQHKGIALSTSISYVIAYIILSRYLKKKHGIESVNKVTIEAGMSILMSVIPAVGMYLVFNRNTLFSNLLIKLLLEGIMYIGIYIMIMFLLRKEKLNDIIKAIRQ